MTLEEIEALRAEVAGLRAERDRANNDRGVLIQTQRALTKRATDAEATVARLTARAGAIRAETIEKCARIADSYGRVWKDRPGPATANAIAEKIRAALGPAGQEAT